MNDEQKQPVGEQAEYQEGKRLAFEQRQERQRREFEAKWEKRKARRDWLMLMITVAAVAASALTVREARRARLEARDAASDALALQITTMQLDERPYVNVTFKSAEKIKAYAGGVGLLALQTVNTYGRTPALNVQIYFDCDEGPKVPAMIEAPPQASRIESRPMVSPGTSSIEIKCAFQTMQKNDYTTHFFGTAFYSDIFDKRHMTQFCLTITYDKPPFKLQAFPCVGVLPKMT